MIRMMLKAVLSLLATLVAAEVALVGVVEATAAVRRRGQQPPTEGFPWEDRPEVELESGDERLKLYPEYEGLYEAMIGEIEGARERIFIETFIWHADDWGRRFVNALREKAREGVEVYAVFDEAANLGQPASFKRFLDEINLLRFRRLRGPKDAINPRSAHRDHRKLLTVDGRVAFVGGWNIGALYTSWRGTHLRVRGDEVHEMERVFTDFWNTHRSEDLPEIPPVRERAWNPALAFHVNDPYSHTFPIRDEYLRAVDRAAERLYVTTAYFTPGPAFRTALAKAAKRGVDVQVLLPERSNHALVDWLGRSYLGELLGSGVRIFEYQDFMLHAKTATVDGIWSTIGSSNVDTLSFFGLHESNLEVHSERLADQMERMFELDKTNARELTLEAWQERPAYDKALQWGIAPLRILG
ncbi:MAG: cardiolipin synthase B [Actinobacteria bacterium]|nr:MAG: cardiolipin synthase B [Actinomycetota bacterium]